MYNIFQNTYWMELQYAYEIKIINFQLFSYCVNIIVVDEQRATMKRMCENENILENSIILINFQENNSSHSSHVTRPRMHATEKTREIWWLLLLDTELGKRKKSSVGGGEKFEN